MRNKKIKLCPQCKSKKVAVEILNPFENDRAVVCEECLYTGSISRQHSVAIKLWNNEVKAKTERTKHTLTQINLIKKESYLRGVKDAAEIADSYNSSTTHPYRLGDCILGKLNQTNRKPRLNTKRLVKIK